MTFGICIQVHTPLFVIIFVLLFFMQIIVIVTAVVVVIVAIVAIIVGHRICCLLLFFWCYQRHQRYALPIRLSQRFWFIIQCGNRNVGRWHFNNATKWEKFECNKKNFNKYDKKKKHNLAVACDI